MDRHNRVDHGEPARNSRSRACEGRCNRRPASCERYGTMISGS